MDVKDLYMENSEWLAQKAKVMELEEVNTALTNVMNSSFFAEFSESARAYGFYSEVLAVKLVKMNCEKELKKTKVRLCNIEQEIRESYNMKVLSAIYSEPLDDYYYERKLNQDGFIKGYKL